MVEFIASNIAIIICCIIGIGLLVLEIFMPGFGLPGISGIILQIVAIALVWINHGPIAALGMTVFTLAIVAIAVSLSLRSATKGRLSRSNMILKNTESAEEGYSTSSDMNVFLGKEGVATTVLRPTGMAEFDGVRLNVVSDGEYIPKDTRVRIDHVEGARILVKAISTKPEA